MKRPFLLFIHAAAILLAGAAAAQQRSALDALEQRGELLGWEAVGRLDKPDGFCTGTLIANDLVLTAAHCVFDGAGRQLPPAQLIFRAGYSNGTSIAERRADRIVVAEGYRHSLDGTQRTQDVVADVALVRLASPISSSEADPFHLHETPREGDRVSVVSYGQGRAEALSRQSECNVTGRYKGGIMSFDCNVTFGSSGAPVFMRYGTRARIVSLISGGRGLGERDVVSYGTELPGVVAQLKAELRNGGSAPIVTSGARRVMVGQRTATGARFVRP